MKTNRVIAVSALVLLMALPAVAMDHGQSGGGHDMGGMSHGEMDHSGHMGAMIHESKVDGYSLAYHLIDMKERMKGMKGAAMKGHDMSKMKSHHLMVYVMGPDGKGITDARVGYKVEGPGDSEQKTMAMGMKGGFGADVDLAKKGTYEIKTKAVAGDKTLIDEFKYEVK